MANNPSIVILTFSFLIASLNLTQAHAESNGAGTFNQSPQKVYTHDPLLSGGIGSPYRPEETRAATISEEKDQTRLQIETGRPIAPYLGAGRPLPPSKEVLHLIRQDERNSFQTIHLETGIGIKIKKGANLNLGYRIQNSSSILEENEENIGQVRFGINFQLPEN